MQWTSSGRIANIKCLIYIEAVSSYKLHYKTRIEHVMDDARDSQKADSLSKFIDNQSIRTSPFGDNKIGERAYRRAERLVAALHLITNHISPEEPVRVMTRQKGLDLLTEFLELRDKMRATASPDFTAVQATIRNLISLIRMLTVGGSVSIQNGEIVIDALDELGNFLTTSVRSAFTESVRLSKNELLEVRDVIKRPIKDIKDSIIQKDVMTDTVRVPEEGAGASKRGERILGVLNLGGEYGIRDIVSHLPEYSEKMIQRELAQLILLGKVAKAGSKRWSRYSALSRDSVSG